MSILLVRGHTLWDKRSFGVKHRIVLVSLYYVLILEHYFSLHFDSISMISHHWCPIIDPLLTVQRVIHHVDQNIIGPNYKGQVSIKILTWKMSFIVYQYWSSRSCQFWSIAADLMSTNGTRLCTNGPDLTTEVSATSNSSKI